METRYGRWTVIDPDDPPGPMVICLCDCGTVRRIARYKLVQGRTKSCGCRRSDLLHEQNLGKAWPKTLAPERSLVVIPGARFGRWTVLSDPEPRGKRKVVLCQCDCGTQRSIGTDNLLYGRTKSCGCLRREGASAMHRSAKDSRANAPGKPA